MVATRRVKTGTLSAAGNVALGLSGAPIVFVGVSGTYGSVTGIIEGSIDGSVWFTVPAIKGDSGFPREGSLALVDNSTNGFYVAASNLTHVRYKVTAISSGTVSVEIVNDVGEVPLDSFNSYQLCSINTALKSVAVAAGSGTADVVAVSTGPGLLNRVIVTTAGTGVLSLYDHASASSGAKLLWSSAATYALGTVTELNIPYELGLVAVQSNGSAAVTIGYSPQ